MFVLLPSFFLSTVLCIVYYDAKYLGIPYLANGDAFCYTFSENSPFLTVVLIINCESYLKSQVVTSFKNNINVILTF
jgi:hypothetical protein